MSEIAKLEKEILANVAAAKDEAALEAVRISALGKSGSVSALLKTLGAMSADERKTQGPAETGRIHPISQVTDELTAIFADMGFAVAEGPDIETDDYNFTKLNFPEGHPAREMHDTFYFPPKPDGTRMLLRTHTSPVQVRTMLKQKPPIRVICPGRTYRSDSDQTHT